VVAVADGVSAGLLSHHAARIVTHHGCARLAKLLSSSSSESIAWPALLHDVSQAVINEGRLLLQAGDGPEEVTARTVAKHLAATAIFAVIPLTSTDEDIDVHLFALGDTSAWVLREGTMWENQQPIKNADAVIASSAVQAIPLVPTTLGPPMRAIIRPGDALVLMSDGIGDPLSTGAGEVGAFLAQAWAEPPQALAFAAHIDFARKSYQDDRTAVALWPLPPS
jgi:hypothetical protein